MERARMAERFGWGNSPDRAATRGDRPAARPNGQRGAQGAAAGTERRTAARCVGKGSRERREQRGTGRAQASRGFDAWPRLEPRQSLLRGQRGPPGAWGQREKEDAAGRGNMKSPAPHCWSFVPGGRHPPNPPAVGGASCAELLDSPRSGKNGYGNCALPGARRQRARERHGPAGRGESGAGGAGPPGSRSPRCSARPQRRPRGSPSS